MDGKSEHSHPSCLLTLNLRQKSRKQGAGKAHGPPRGTPAWVRVPRPRFLSASITGHLGALSCGWASRDLPPGQVAPAAGLEADDAVRDLQVLLLLKVGQHTGPEEDLALADAVQVAVELKGFDLEGESRLLALSKRLPLPPSNPGARPKSREGLELGLGLLL